MVTKDGYEAVKKRVEIALLLEAVDPAAGKDRYRRERRPMRVLMLIYATHREEPSAMKPILPQRRMPLGQYGFCLRTHFAMDSP